MYEYKVVNADRPISETQLNELGRQGWKLIQLVPFTQSGHMFLVYLVRDKTN